MTQLRHSPEWRVASIRVRTLTRSPRRREKAALSVHIGHVSSVGHEKTLPGQPDRGHFVASRKRSDLVTLEEKECFPGDDESTSPLAHKGLKSCFDFAWRAGIESEQSH